MSQIVPLTVRAPGFYGLNKQESGDVLPPGWATKASNLVIDELGRLARRKGTKYLGDTDITSSPDIKSAHIYIDAAGNESAPSTSASARGCAASAKS